VPALPDKIGSAVRIGLSLQTSGRRAVHAKWYFAFSPRCFLTRINPYRVTCRPVKAFQP
jgi:hypothetical protein